MKADSATSQGTGARQHQGDGAGEGGQRAGRRKWQILEVVVAGALMAMPDTTIVNVAMPSIAVGTHAGAAD